MHWHVDDAYKYIGGMGNRPKQKNDEKEIVLAVCVCAAADGFRPVLFAPRASVLLPFLATSQNDKATHMKWQ